MKDTQFTALIADADRQHTAALAEHLRERGWRTRVEESLDAARAALEADSIDLAVIALVCGGEDSLALFEEDRFAEVDEVIVMGDEDDPATVERAIRKGASYFFLKPFDALFLDELVNDLAAEIGAVSPAKTEDDPNPLDQFGAMRGSSRPMKRMYRILRKVAPSDASVLLIGESGSGKELAAQTIYALSRRADAPFLAMNCGAIPSDLFESELFGHEKGAFTGAVREHRGIFERADGGTLFLDEITEMPVELQVKLLRVLEVGKFRRVGGERDLTADVRIIAATNRDPMEAIAEGRLREDLYYRVASFPVTIPPLRRRGDDIVGLAQFFLSLHNQSNGTSVILDDGAIARLEAYDWPGNVRELIAAVERAYVLATDVVRADHLPGLDTEEETIQVDEDRLTVSVGASIEEMEKELIVTTLAALDGDKRAAAETLGISLKTLYNRLNEYEKDR